MEEFLLYMKKLFPLITINSDDELMESGLMSSYDFYFLTTALEEDFEIEIPQEEITAENFKTVAAIYAMVCRLAKK